MRRFTCWARPSARIRLILLALSKPWAKKEGRYRHVLREIVAAGAAHAAGRNLGCPHRPLLLGALYQARSAACLGNPQGRPDRRHERARGAEGHEERRSGAAVHGFLALDRRSEGAGRKLVDSPTNKEVKVSDEVANNITYGDQTAKSLQLIPSAVTLDNRDKWLSEWNAKVGQ